MTRFFFSSFRKIVNRVCEFGDAYLIHQDVIVFPLVHLRKKNKRLILTVLCYNFSVEQ